jgi:peptidoglycan/LPS O-acetylase OafA/YrhL
VPPPIQAEQRYVAGLDGIRALAVLCVIAYHVNIPWARGGLLGVGVFFTLSGYLITDLLLDRFNRHGDLGLRNFWLRRARRLLPALFLMLAAVSVWVAFFDTSQLAGVRRQVIAAVFYFNNWSTIAQHGSYFARFAAPLPLDHLWSLAIEEQFYLVWPWLLLAGVSLIRRRGTLALVALTGAVASAIAMGLLYHPGYDPTRVYEGTDTRAFGLLIGAALAIALPVRRNGNSRPAPSDVRNILDVAGVLGLLCVGVLVWRTNALSRFLYPYGLLLLSLATVVLIVAAVEPTSRVGAALSWGPLRWVGVRSYGIYLWQWPIVVLANPSQTTFSPLRAALETGGAVAIAALSWRYVEEPIRHGALGRMWAQARAGASRFVVRRRALRLSTATLVAVSLAALGLGGALPGVSASLVSASADRLPSIPRVQIAAEPGNALDSVPAFFHATRSACRSVIYIGDSTSAGEISTNYIPDASKRLPEQLADVGVRTTYPEISVARSIIETYKGEPNAQTVAQQQVSAGFRGCWVLALGTNEAANVAVGSSYGYAARIDRMMSIAHGEPVLWIDSVTLVRSGPYAESGVLRWNKALFDACARYPNLRVFDWASEAKPRWFIPDGIHYYSPGYVARSHDIAQALMRAFPAGAAPSSGCVVR